MAVSAPSQLSEFASDVRDAFSPFTPVRKLSPRFLYDDLGSSLFEAITLLPEYGLSRADDRLLRLHSGEIADYCGSLSAVAELGSGSGKKTTNILHSALKANAGLTYYPIDVSSAALSACEREIGTQCHVVPLCQSWLEGLATLSLQRPTGPLLLLFLGSSIGNLERAEIPDFLKQLRSHLRTGDFFLLGADLVKDVRTMIAAYDDPTGVTAAFNLNLLGRINRELDADFDLRCFRHEARWNEQHRRIEMHLVSLRDQRVHIGALDAAYLFKAGEAIWTESSHKFELHELDAFANATGFCPVGTWVDDQWPLAETLWQAVS